MQRTEWAILWQGGTLSDDVMIAVDPRKASNTAAVSRTVTRASSPTSSESTRATSSSPRRIVVATVRALKSHSGKHEVVAHRPLPEEMLKENPEDVVIGAANLILNQEHVPEGWGGRGAIEQDFAFHGN
jgi:hypothetical protein